MKVSPYRHYLILFAESVETSPTLTGSSISLISGSKGPLCGKLFVYYHFLQDQYLALCLGPGLSQLCLALKDLRAQDLIF